MPASLPGDTLANNQGNPSAGDFVALDPLSGPKGAPLDAKKFDYTTGTPPGWSTTRVPITVNDPLNLSTGQLCTGIGMNAQDVIGVTAPASIFRAGFNDNDIPGEVPTYAAPPPPGVVASSAIDSKRMYIGGGRMIANTGTTPADRGVPFITSPYTAGIAICGAGNGASRDGGAGPTVFTGFPMKMVTNGGTVAIANGGTIEAGFVNRSGGSLAVGESAFGSAAAQLAAPS